MIFKAKSLACIFSAIVLTACGGGGGTTSTGGGTTSYTGTYIDSPTKGLSYSASPSGLSGVTDASGTFAFNAGDTVSFAITTPNGTISAGSTTPATPTSASVPAVVSVLSMKNGVSIAQTLQSLGGTGAVIDVSSTVANVASLSSNQMTAIHSYVTSGCATTAPAQLTVDANSALINAASSLSSIPNQVSNLTVQQLLSGTTMFLLGTVNVPDLSVKFLEANIEYFNPNGTFNKLCINTPVINPGYTGTISNLCAIAETGVTASGTWSISSNTTNSFLQNITLGGQVATFTAPTVNATGGVVNVSVANVQDLPSGLTANATYTIVQNNINITSFGGKTVTLGGSKYCSDGYMNYIFSSDGTTFTATCKTSSSVGSNFTSATGVASNVSLLPGVLMLTTNGSGSVAYLGLTVGSTLSAGTVAKAAPGTRSCSSTNLSACGSVQIVSFTSQ